MSENNEFERRVAQHLPHQKIKDEILALFDQGMTKFVLMTVPFKKEPITAPVATKQLHKVWGADIGFKIKAITNKELFDIINATVIAYPTAELIYFECDSPEIGRSNNYRKIDNVILASQQAEQEMYEDEV